MQLQEIYCKQNIDGTWPRFHADVTKSNLHNSLVAMEYYGDSGSQLNFDASKVHSWNFWKVPRMQSCPVNSFSKSKLGHSGVDIWLDETC